MVIRVTFGDKPRKQKFREPQMRVRVSAVGAFFRVVDCDVPVLPRRGRRSWIKDTAGKFAGRRPWLSGLSRVARPR